MEYLSILTWAFYALVVHLIIFSREQVVQYHADAWGVIQINLQASG